MSSAKAIVPVLGCLLLLVGGLATLFVDRATVLKNPQAPRPVLLRYTSQASYDLKQPSHWLFLTVTVLFAPLVMVTATWQKMVAEQVESPVGGDIQVFAILCGACGVGVAASPMGNALGSILHTVLAGVFTARGINYCVRASTLASDRGHDALAAFRTACWIVACVASLVIVTAIYPGAMGTERLRKHELNMQEFSPSQIRMARIGEFVLAIGQVSVGTMIGICVMSAVTDVVDVRETDDEDDNEALFIGLVAAAAGSVVFVAAYILNDRFYVLCQAENETDENHRDNEEQEQQVEE